MFPIASQTAGPIGLKFIVDTQGWPEGDIGKKKSKIFFFKIFFFHRQRRALQLVLNINRFVNDR